MQSFFQNIFHKEEEDRESEVKFRLNLAYSKYLKNIHSAELRYLINDKYKHDKVATAWLKDKRKQEVTPMLNDYLNSNKIPLAHSEATKPSITKPSITSRAHTRLCDNLSWKSTRFLFGCATQGGKRKPRNRRIKKTIKNKMRQTRTQ